jgi:hypothetical protein
MCGTFKQQHDFQVYFYANFETMGRMAGMISFGMIIAVIKKIAFTTHKEGVGS